MAQRASLLFLLTGFLLAHSLTSPHALVAMDPHGEDGPPHKKRRLNSPPQAASETPLAQAAPVEEASSVAPPCATLPCAPKKPTAARKVLTSAYKCNPWDKEDFKWRYISWGYKHAEIFKPYTYIRDAAYGLPWENVLRDPAFTQRLAEWQQALIQKPPRGIQINAHRESAAAPWEIDRTFFNTRGFAQVQSFKSERAIRVLPAFSFADNLVCLDLKLPIDGRALCEGISKLTQLRSLTLCTWFPSSTGRQNFRHGHYGEHRILQPLSTLEKLEYFSLDLSFFNFSPNPEDNEKLLLDLGPIVQNNPNLKELHVGESDHDSRTPERSGMEKILADRAFEFLWLGGCEIKSLAGIRTEKLRELRLEIAGTIEEGFSQKPLNLTKIYLDKTLFTFPFFETLPLEKITDVEIQAPCDLNIFKKMTALRTFEMSSASHHFFNIQPSTCLQDLDCLHLEHLESVELHISDVDIPFVRMAVEKKPALNDAITRIDMGEWDCRTLAEAIQGAEEGSDED